MNFLSKSCWHWTDSRVKLSSSFAREAYFLTLATRFVYFKHQHIALKTLKHIRNIAQFLLWKGRQDRFGPIQLAQHANTPDHPH